MRFDTSLESLVQVLEQHGIDVASPAICIVRDAKGRLTVASTAPYPPQLGAALSEALGAYAAHGGVVGGALAERLHGDPAAQSRFLDFQGKSIEFKLIDRRIVGADWLREPAPVSSPPRLVFGSLKGGVGRSTALAVLGADFAAHRKRVLAIDLDLEAPGIGAMLLPVGGNEGVSRGDQRLDLRPRFGVIDYLLEIGLDGVTDESLIDFVGISSFGGGLLHVLPAVGRETDLHPANMMAKLSRAMVEQVSSDGTRKSVAEQVTAMVDRFAARDKYDVVLIDSRAGLAELSAAALFATGAAAAMLFGTDQEQTFRGYRYLLAHLVQTWGVGDNDWRSRITFVQAKAPASRQKRQAFRERLYELCAEQLYDQEQDQEGEQAAISVDIFNFGPDEARVGVPHDASYVAFHPDYDAFDPVAEQTQLDEDVYRGPFGDFLDRGWQLLGESRPARRPIP